MTIKAFNTNESFDIADIKSGNSHSVNVTIDIEAGTYSSGVTANGVNQDLDVTGTMNLPSGDYYLVIVGYNWGGPGNFFLKVNGLSRGWDANGSTDIGTVYTPTVSTLTV